MFAGDLLRERARVTPDRLALVSVETGERLTYADLDARCDSAAAYLAGCGISAGDRFGLLAHNCVEFIALFFAAGRVRAIVVPLSTRATEHELRGIAADCAMKALFAGPEFTVDLGIPRHDVGPALQPARTGWRAGPTSAEQPYCLLYTSGTTGKPKGVIIPRRQLYWNGYNTALNWDLRADDVSPIFTPLYHAGGLAAFLIPIFCAGGAMVLHRAFNASEVWRTIQEERCTVVLGVPTSWKMLLDAPELAGADLSHVRWFISGGAPLPAYIIEAYQQRGVPMKQGFGMTEVGVNCFTMTVEESYRKAGSIGRPMLFTEVLVVDADGRELPHGEVGEMWIRGPHVSNGYWNNEEATRAAYASDGWFKTGDLARRDEEGFFYIAGRRKEMFISGGVNVYPAEIEAELVSHPLVADAAVVPVPDATWGEVGVAFVVARVGCEELDAYLSSRLSKYKLPKQYIFLEALPRTPYGKVEKHRLSDMLNS
ncbi:MAG TPA: AMP-binding protein [Thermoanaerobaculia bacterium]|jgi:fatty-acyl-CoA synthase|nr:AMP-binding protein [Thermoanaerobaculia bacterium]